VTDEPSNAASEYMRVVLAFLQEYGAPSEELVRAGLSDDFAYEDRRHGPSFPGTDAQSHPRFLQSIWETGVGRPEFAFEVLAVRGERFAAVALQVDYGNGMVTESIHVVALDATLSVACRGIDFDLDDVEGAIAEMDRLQSQAGAS
jgi:hypothetical protein